MVDFRDVKRVMQVLDEKSGGEEFCTCAVLIFVLEGRMEIKIYDRAVVLDQEDMLLVNIGDSYTFQNSRNAFFIKVIIPNEILCSIGENLPVFACNSVSENNENYGKMRLTLRRLLMNYWLQEQKEMNQEALTSGFASLYYHLVELLLENFQGKEEKYKENKKIKNDERAHQISSYIQKNYAKPISLQELSEQLYLSESYLSRYFKQKFGMNFSNYLKKIRLAHVMDDLQNTDNNITQIIYENGFSGPAFFYKEFKREYGVSPSEIRDKMVKEKKTLVTGKEEGYSKKLEKYLGQENLEDEDAEVIKQNIEVAGDSEGILHYNWNKILNIGSAARLLEREIQEHVTIIKNAIKVEYIRIWDIFSSELLIDIEEKDGRYNFRKLDQVLDFILSLKLKPFLDFEKKPTRINTNGQDTLEYREEKLVFSSISKWAMLIEKTLEHWIERYGREEIAGWKLEVWYGGYWLEGQSSDESFWNIFETTYSIVKKKVPEIMVGGPGIFPGCMSGTKENEFLTVWSQRKIHPDFISVMSYGYEVDPEIDQWKNEESYERLEVKKAFRQKSRNESFLCDQIKYIKNWMKNTGMADCDIYISEWNKTISDRCCLSDSCYQGAYIVKNLIEADGEVDSVVYNGGLDLMTEFYDSKDILFGGKGLLTKDGIFKPSGYALQFMSELYENQIVKYMDCLVTGDGNGSYAVVCHNMKQLSQYYYYTDEGMIEKENLWKCFEDRRKKKISMYFVKIPEGNYRIKIWRVNEDYGSILGAWKVMGFEQNLSKTDKKYLEGICQPKLSLERRKVDKKGLSLELEMSANEIALIKIKRI